MKSDPASKRRAKRTVTIEVRVSEEEKSAFTHACQTSRQTVSAVLRRLMGGFVAFETFRHRTLQMIKHMVDRPAKAVTAALVGAIALSASLFMASGASAERDLAYLVRVSDGVGFIVSHGRISLSDVSLSGEPIGDQLGTEVGYALRLVPCHDPALDCSSGPRHAALSVAELRNGDVFTERVYAIELAESGETQFQITLSDERVLSATFLSQSAS